METEEIEIDGIVYYGTGDAFRSLMYLKGFMFKDISEWLILATGDKELDFKEAVQTAAKKIDADVVDDGNRILVCWGQESESGLPLYTEIRRRYHREQRGM